MLYFGNWFSILNYIEHARKHPDCTEVSIVKETKRKATVQFVFTDKQEIRHVELSKRNKNEASALNVAKRYMSGELATYAYV